MVTQEERLADLRKSNDKNVSTYFRRFPALIDRDGYLLASLSLSCTLLFSLPCFYIFTSFEVFLFSAFLFRGENWTIICNPNHQI